MSATEPAHPAWQEALFSLLHPLQVAIVEAHLWVAEPLSAHVLYELFAEEWRLDAVSYHVRRPAAVGVLEELFTTPARGAIAHHYGLAR